MNYYATSEHMGLQISLKLVKQLEISMWLTVSKMFKKFLWHRSEIDAQTQGNL